MPHSFLSLPKTFLLLLLILVVAPVALAQGGTSGPQEKSSLRLSWEGTPGVNRYRLQVSLDAQFTDLVFDRAVEGREYVINDLPVGKYYWRVAPAAQETGTFSKSRTIDIPSGGTTITATGNQGTSERPPSKTGWTAATGSVAQPLAFYLREQSAPDVVGVNSEGMVYAIDATNGVALWTARFRPDAKRGEPTGNGGAQPFQPVALGASNGLQNVLVAFEGGVRLIEGATGRELWRTSLPGRAASAVAGDLNGDGAMEITVFYDNEPGIIFLDTSTGRVVGQGQAKLAALSIGAPAALSSKTDSGALLALANGTLEFWNVKGERVRSNKLDLKFTTPPLIVQTTQTTMAMIGTDHGLIAIDVSNLKPLWRVATEGDAPRGQLAAADLDNDGAPEVVMITRRGRTVAVNTANGKIKWYANIANRAGIPLLTDLNGDGLTDVLIASDAASMVGHDGRNGALIFGETKTAINTTAGATDETQTYQTCAYITTRSGSQTLPLVVCNDPAGGGLRADGLPSGR
ncbi:MAG TPA: PQQ-binding-like beta-propeller repeat protein [Pyrinomonadaceae bacterium]